MVLNLFKPKPAPVILSMPEQYVAQQPQQQSRPVPMPPPQYRQQPQQQYQQPQQPQEEETEDEEGQEYKLSMDALLNTLTAIEEAISRLHNLEIDNKKTNLENKELLLDLKSKFIDDKVSKDSKTKEKDK